MVEAARRRATELGLDGCSVRRRERRDPLASRRRRRSRRLPLRDHARPRHGARLPSEIARVLRPGGTAVLAVWASTSLNPWMTAPGGPRSSSGYMEPTRPRRPGPVPALRSRATPSGRRERRAHDRDGRGGAGALGRRLARRVVGDDPRHVTDAHAAHRASHAGRDRGAPSTRRGSTWRSSSERRLGRRPGRRPRRRSRPLRAEAGRPPRESSCRARSR